MIYEAQITYQTTNEKGLEVTKKENYVVPDAERFEQVEKWLFNRFQLTHDCLDVVAVKRSKIMEVANDRTSDDDLIWCAELQDVFHDDDGSEKTTKYKILLFAKTFDSAKAFISEYAKCGYSMELVSLKMTKFVGVL